MCHESRWKYWFKLRYPRLHFIAITKSGNDGDQGAYHEFWSDARISLDIVGWFHFLLTEMESDSPSRIFLFYSPSPGHTSNSQSDYNHIRNTGLRNPPPSFDPISMEIYLKCVFNWIPSPKPIIGRVLDELMGNIYEHSNSSRWICYASLSLIGLTLSYHSLLLNQIQTNPRLIRFNLNWSWLYLFWILSEWRAQWFVDGKITCDYIVWILFISHFQGRV